MAIVIVHTSSSTHEKEQEKAHPFFLKKATSSGVSESTPYGIVRAFHSAGGVAPGATGQRTDDIGAQLPTARADEAKGPK